MLSGLLDPFRSDFMLHALLGGVLVAIVCAVIGTWVVIRGMAFLGEALGHGMLPGVALATVLGLPVIVGGAVSAVLMSALIGAVQRRGKLSYDTSIGLLFVAMLSAGVIIVSHSRSFATDATTLLFGELLALSGIDLLTLLGAAVVTIVLALVFHRGFVAVAFDPRIADAGTSTAAVPVRAGGARDVGSGLGLPGRGDIAGGRATARTGGGGWAVDPQHSGADGRCRRFRLGSGGLRAVGLLARR